MGNKLLYKKPENWTTKHLKQYETEITISSAGTKYLYVYNYVDNTTIYIKDVEVLGKYEDHAEAQFYSSKMTLSKQEVKRAEAHRRRT